MKFKQIFEGVIVPGKLNIIRTALLSFENNLYSGNYTTNELVYREFLRIFSKNLKLNKIGVNFSISSNLIIDDLKALNGDYDLYSKELNIEIPENIDSWLYENKNNYKKFVNILMLTLEHELIHKKQWSKVKKSNTEKAIKGYDNFKDKQEIMAYAKTAINELRNNGKTKKYILKILKNFEQYKKEVLESSLSFSKYYELFGIDRKTNKENREIWQRFLDYIYRYLIK